MSDVLNAALQGTVRKVTFRSQVTPDYVYDPFAPSAPPSEGQSWLMNFIRPEVTVETIAGPVVVAPYGTPEHDYGLALALGSVAGLVGVVMLISAIARATK